MRVSECSGKWKFFNFQEIVDGLEGTDEATRRQITEALFRVLEYPHSPRGFVWFANSG